jgi:SAM-dependent methyltransferase
MKFNPDIEREYISVTPFPLALERLLECRIYHGQTFERPILDVGCGEGLFAKILFAEKIDTGIDPNKHELERARQLGAYDELLECWGNAIPKPDGSYRTVFSNSVLEHIPDLKPVLKEVHRLLEKGGRFYFTVPSESFEQYSLLCRILMAFGAKGPAARYRKFFNSFWRHYHYYTLPEWETLARDAGFEVVESYTYNPRVLCTLNDSLVPFTILSFVLKRLTNRWSLFPKIWKCVLSPFQSLIRRMLDGGEKVPHGGLVFLSLRKV